MTGWRATISRNRARPRRRSSRNSSSLENRPGITFMLRLIGFMDSLPEGAVHTPAPRQARRSGATVATPGGRTCRRAGSASYRAAPAGRSLGAAGALDGPDTASAGPPEAMQSPSSGVLPSRGRTVGHRHPRRTARPVRQTRRKLGMSASPTHTHTHTHLGVDIIVHSLPAKELAIAYALRHLDVHTLAVQQLLKAQERRRCPGVTLAPGLRRQARMPQRGQLHCRRGRASACRATYSRAARAPAWPPDGIAAAGGGA